MRRLNVVLSKQVGSRNFSANALSWAPRPPSRYDSEGRTPGFARRRVPQSQHQHQNQHQHEFQHQSQQDPASQEQSSSPQEPNVPSKNKQLSVALQQSSESNSNGLLSPVHIPEDHQGILKSDHPSTAILANSSIIVQRQLEMMNVFLGFEQANRYIVMDPQGGHIGYLAEQEHGIGGTVMRQMLRTHRSFTTHVFDRHEKEVLRFHRPLSWINSRIRVYDALNTGSEYQTSSALQGTSPGSISDQTSAQTSPLRVSEMRIIGEAQQEWAPLRRKYNLFLHRRLSDDPSDPKTPQLTSGDLPLSKTTALQTTNSPDNRQVGFAQFAAVNEPFLSWDFALKSSDDRLIGSVNRNFAGWGREIFTDTGVYALRMDAVGVDVGQTLDREDVDTNSSIGMTLDQRAVMLATAVSIDFDYFSRHSNAGHGAGFMPMWFPVPFGGGGGGAAAETGAAGAAGTGAAEGGAASGAVQEAQAGVRGVGGMGESAATGAATMAGYEAMQRGVGQAPQQQQQEMPPQDMADGDNWDPWGSGGGGQGGGGGGGSGGGGDGGGGDGGGGGFDVDDWF